MIVDTRSDRDGGAGDEIQRLAKTVLSRWKHSTAGPTCRNSGLTMEYLWTPRRWAKALKLHRNHEKQGCESSLNDERPLDYSEDSTPKPPLRDVIKLD
ncbi:hypothetical protein ANTQUA_LOCUS9860 [Anthophora quadrimaculata]